jgi:hypothetical protein
MATDGCCLGLFRRRQCLVPTWRGALALGLGAAFVVVVFLREIHPFLAMNQPVVGGLLVAEGWSSDQTMEVAVAEFHRNHYEKLYVTGGPIERGAPLSQYKTYAELGAAILVKLGLSTNDVQAVPGLQVRKDRTYAEAVTLRGWLRDHRITATKVHVLTGGPHARRSRLLFEKALGKDIIVGVTAVSGGEEYDPYHWWRSSAGFRTVIGETLAYGYARFFFRTSEG